jgi:hypothetical protein
MTHGLSNTATNDNTTPDYTSNSAVPSKVHQRLGDRELDAVCGGSGQGGVIKGGWNVKPNATV